MSSGIKQHKRELRIGMAGVFLTFIGWKILSFFIFGFIPSAVIPALNTAATYSMALPPLILTLRSKPNITGLGITCHHLPRQIAVGIVLGLAMGCVLSMLPMALGLKQLVYTGSGYRGTGEALRRLAYYLFVIGVVEEFIFRGFAYHHLKQICMSDVTPILISSALFGLLHFTGLNFSQILTTGLIGAFFCICREKIPHCTLLSLAIAHGLHDWLIHIFASIF